MLVFRAVPCERHSFEPLGTSQALSQVNRALILAFDHSSNKRDVKAVRSRKKSLRNDLNAFGE